MFKCRGFGADDIPYEIRMDDIHLDETMMVEFSPRSCETVIKNSYHTGGPGGSKMK